MRLSELNTQKIDAKAEQAWDDWDREIEADLQAGKLDHVIEEAAAEAKTAEPL